MATPSAWRSRPRRRASVSTARRSLVPSTSTTPRSCITASDQLDDEAAALPWASDASYLWWCLGSSVRHASTFLLGGVLVCAGAQPYLGARIVSGDEMIDGVLSPRGLRPLGLWRPASAERVDGGSIAGAGRKRIG